MWLLNYWDRLLSGFWFLPAIMAIGAAVLAYATVTLDEAVSDEWLNSWGWVYTGGAEGASAVLGTITSSMMTITGLVFSMTLVALSLASSQFGPRLLRNFMRDTINQVVLGTFVATFLYCLLVLRTIRRVEESLFVPHISVTLGVLFALASLGVLIYFIHHVSMSIQADTIIARVGTDLADGIDRLFPAEIGKAGLDRSAAPTDAGLPETFAHDARPIDAPGDGYVQMIDADALLRLTREEDLIVRVERRPGHYVMAGQPLARVWPGSRIDETLVGRFQAVFVLGSQRTPNQDVEFVVLQLVEIAVRALSPGVNDPFTAITCVDRLGSALGRLAQRETPSPYRLDEQGQLRIVIPPVTFAGIVETAFNQIRQNARTNVAVSLCLLETLAAIAGVTRRPEQRAALRQQAEIIDTESAAVPVASDRLAIAERYRAALLALTAADRS